MVYYYYCYTLILCSFGVRCDLMRFTVLSPFIEKSMYIHIYFLFVNVIVNFSYQCCVKTRCKLSTISNIQNVYKICSMLTG